MDFVDIHAADVILPVIAKGILPTIADLSIRLDNMERYANAGRNGSAAQEAHDLIVRYHDSLPQTSGRTLAYEIFDASVAALRSGRMGSLKNAYYGLDKLCADVDKFRPPTSS